MEKISVMIQYYVVLMCPYVVIWNYEVRGGNVMTCQTIWKTMKSMQLDQELHKVRVYNIRIAGHSPPHHKNKLYIVHSVHKRIQITCFFAKHFGCAKYSNI